MIRKILASIILLTTLCACNNIEKKKNRTIFIENEKGKIALNITNYASYKNDLSKIEVYSKRKGSQKYILLKTMQNYENKIYLDIPPFIEHNIKIVFTTKKNKNINLKEVSVIKQMENVALDRINEWKLQVYLPKSYLENTEKKYPVIYFLDGQNIFTKWTATNGISWEVSKTLDFLINQNKITEPIVVGIEGNSKRFPEFETLVNTIMPYVENKYRIIKNKKNRAIIGSSGGASYSLMMGYRYNYLFGNIGLISLPPFRGGLELINKYPKQDLKIWIDAGTKEEERGYFSEGARNVIDILIEKGYKYGKELVYYEAIGEEHSEDAWSKRIKYPIIFFYGKEKSIEIKKITEEIDISKGQGIYSRKNQLIEMQSGLIYSDIDKYFYLPFNNNKINDTIELYSFSEKHNNKKLRDYKKLLNIDIKVFDGIDFIELNSIKDILCLDEKTKVIEDNDIVELINNRNEIKLKYNKQEMILSNEVMNIKLKDYFLEDISIENKLYMPLYLVFKILNVSCLFLNNSDLNDGYYIFDQTNIIKDLKKYSINYDWYYKLGAYNLTEEMKLFTYIEINNILREGGKKEVISKIEANQNLYKKRISDSNSDINFYDILNDYLNLVDSSYSFYIYGRFYPYDKELKNWINLEKESVLKEAYSNIPDDSFYWAYDLSTEIDNNRKKRIDLFNTKNNTNYTGYGDELIYLKNNINDDSNYYILPDNSILIKK